MSVVPLLKLGSKLISKKKELDVLPTNEGTPTVESMISQFNQIKEQSTPEIKQTSVQIPTAIEEKEELENKPSNLNRVVGLGKDIAEFAVNPIGKVLKTAAPVLKTTADHIGSSGELYSQKRKMREEIYPREDVENAIESLKGGRHNFRERLEIQKKYQKSADYYGLDTNLEKDFRPKEGANPASKIVAGAIIANPFVGVPILIAGKRKGLSAGDVLSKLGETNVINPGVDFIGRNIDRAFSFFAPGTNQAEQAINEDKRENNINEAKTSSQLSDVIINATANLMNAGSAGEDIEPYIDNIDTILSVMETRPEISNHEFTININGQNLTIEQFKKVAKKWKPEQFVANVDSVLRQLYVQQEKTREIERQNPVATKGIINEDKRRYGNIDYQSVLVAPDGSPLGLNPNLDKSEEQLKAEKVAVMAIDSYISASVDQYGIPLSRFADGIEGSDGDDYMLQTIKGSIPGAKGIREYILNMSPEDLNKLATVNGLNTKELQKIYDSDAVRDATKALAVNSSLININLSKDFANTVEAPLGRAYQKVLAEVTFGNRGTGIVTGNGRFSANKLLFTARANLSDVPLHTKIAKMVGNSIGGATVYDWMSIASLPINFAIGGSIQMVKATKFINKIGKVTGVTKMANRFKSIKYLDDIASATQRYSNSNRATRGMREGIIEAARGLPLNLSLDALDQQGASFGMGPGIDASVGWFSGAIRRVSQAEKLVRQFDGLTLQARVDRLKKMFPGENIGLNVTKSDVILMQQKAISELSSGTVSDAVVNSVIENIKRNGVQEGSVRQFLGSLKNLTDTGSEGLKFAARNILEFMRPVSEAINQINDAKKSGTTIDSQKVLNDAYSKFVDQYSNNFVRGVLGRYIESNMYTAFFDSRKNSIKSKLNEAGIKPTEEQLDMFTNQYLMGGEDAKYMINEMVGGKKIKQDKLDKTLEGIREELIPIERLGDSHMTELVDDGADLSTAVKAEIQKDGGNPEEGLAMLSDMITSKETNPNVLIKFGDDTVEVSPSEYQKAGKFLGQQRFSNFLARAQRFARGLSGRTTLGEIQKGLGDVINYVTKITPSDTNRLLDILPKIDGKLVNKESQMRFIADGFKGLLSEETLYIMREGNENINTILGMVQRDIFQSALSMTKKNFSNIIKGLPNNAPKVMISGLAETAYSTRNIIASAISKSSKSPKKLMDTVVGLIQKTMLENNIQRLKRIRDKINKPIQNIEPKVFNEDLFESITEAILGNSTITNTDSLAALIMKGDGMTNSFGERGLQSAEQTVSGVISAMNNNKILPLHPIYYSENGRRILDTYMKEILTADDYKSYLKKYESAYKKYIGKQNMEIQTMLAMFDEAGGMLDITRTDADGKVFSLGDFLLGRSVAYSKNGIISSPVLGLIQFISRGGKNGEFLKGFFNSSLKKVVESMENGGNAAQRYVTEGEGRWMEIYESLRAKFTAELSKDPTVINIDDLVVDMLDPMLYSHRQYFENLPDGDILNKDVMEDIIFGMLASGGGNNSAYFNKIRDGLKIDYTFNMGSAYDFKNLDYSETAIDFANYMQTSGIPKLSMTQADISDYIYKFFGEGLLNLPAGIGKSENLTAMKHLDNLATFMRGSGLTDMNITQEISTISKGEIDDVPGAIDSLRNKFKNTDVEASASEAIDYLEYSLLKETKDMGKKLLEPTITAMLNSLYKTDVKDISTDAIQNAEFGRTLANNQANIVKTEMDNLIRRLENPTGFERTEHDPIFKAVQKRIKDMEKRYAEISKMGDYDVTFDSSKLKDKQFFNFVKNVNSGKTNLITYNYMSNKGYMKKIEAQANELAIQAKDKRFLRMGVGGNIVIAHNENLNWWRRAFLNMNTGGGITARDAEMMEVIGSAVDLERGSIGIKEGNNTNFKFISQFRNDVQTKYIQLMSPNGKVMSVDEHSAVIDFANNNWRSGNYNFNNTNLNAAQKELALFLMKDVIDPLNNFRKFKGLGTIDQIDGGMSYFLKPVMASGNKQQPTTYARTRFAPLQSINSLFGHAMFMPVQDINRLTSKYGVGENGKEVILNFARDFMLNGVNDGSILDKAIQQIGTSLERVQRKGGKFASKSAVLGAFFIAKNPPSMFQQAFQQFMLANDMKRTYKIDSNLLYAIQNIIGGPLTENKGFWHTDTILENLNYIMQSDKISYREVQQALIAQALYIVSEAGGNDYARTFVTQLNRTQEFMNKYKIRDYNSFNTASARNQVDRRIKLEEARLDDLIAQGGDNVADLIKERENLNLPRALIEYNQVKGFVASDFLRFKGMYEASLASQFVISQVKSATQIPLLNATQITKNSPKFLFGLMKWSMSTVGRWGTRVFDAIDTLSDISKGGDGTFASGVRNLVRNIELGRAKDVEALFSEVAIMTLSAIKANDQLGRLGGEEYNSYDLIMQPLAGFSMLFGWINSGIQKGSEYARVSRAGGGSTDIPGSILVGFGASASDLAARVSLIEYLGFKDLIEAVSTGIATESLFMGLKSFAQSYFLGFLNKVGGYKASGYTFENDMGDWVNRALFNAVSQNEKDLRRAGVANSALSIYTADSIIDKTKGALSINGGSLGLILGMLNRSPEAMSNQNLIMEHSKKYIDGTPLNGIISQFSTPQQNLAGFTWFDKNNRAMAANRKKIFGSEDHTMKSFLELNVERHEDGQVTNSPLFGLVTSILSPTNANQGTDRIITFEITNTAELQGVRDEMTEKLGAHKYVDTKGDGFKRFVAEVERMGTNTTLGDIMKIYTKGAHNTMLDNLIAQGVATKEEVSAYKKGAPLQDWGVKVLEDMTKIEHAILLQTKPMWDQEYAVVKEISTKAIQNDPNAPGFFQTTAGNMNTNLGIIQEAYGLLKYTKENGVYDNGGAFGFAMSRSINTITKLQVGDDPESKEKANKAARAALYVVGRVGEMVDRVYEEPGDNAKVKIGMAGLALPLIAKMSGIGLDEPLEGLMKWFDNSKKGDKVLTGNIADTVSSLTNASPTDIKSAFENITNVAGKLPGDGKGKKINTKLPEQKIKLFKAQLADYNKLATIGAKAFNLPRFTYHVVKEGSYPKIKASEIKLPNIPRGDSGSRTDSPRVAGKPRKFGVIKGRVLSRGGRTIKGKSTKIGSI